MTDSQNPGLDRGQTANDAVVGQKMETLVPSAHFWPVRVRQTRRDAMAEARARRLLENGRSKTLQESIGKPAS